VAADISEIQKQAYVNAPQ